MYIANFWQPLLLAKMNQFLLVLCLSFMVHVNYMCLVVIPVHFCLLLCEFIIFVMTVGFYYWLLIAQNADQFKDKHVYALITYRLNKCGCNS
jgi:hypothetical protein